MQMFVLDLATLFTPSSSSSSSFKSDPVKNKMMVNWQTPIVEFPGAPLDTILYTLNKGIDEIILFGGMEVVS